MCHFFLHVSIAELKKIFDKTKSKLISKRAYVVCWLWIYCVVIVDGVLCVEMLVSVQKEPLVKLVRGTHRSRRGT